MQALKNAFRGFDPNDLDFNNAGSWPIGVKVVIYLVLFVGVILAGLHFYVSDLDARLEREVRQEQDLKLAYERKAFQVANLAALRQQMADVEEKFSELLRQLPTDKEVPGLLEDITEIGIGAGLQIDTIALQPERKNQFYIELPISIRVTGSYHEMGQFVSGIAAIKRIVTLHDYSITGSGDRLNMNITAKTYRYDDTQ